MGLDYALAIFNMLHKPSLLYQSSNFPNKCLLLQIEKHAVSIYKSGIDIETHFLWV